MQFRLFQQLHVHCCGMLPYMCSFQGMYISREPQHESAALWKLQVVSRGVVPRSTAAALADNLVRCSAAL
jgi:hypothetical protein